MFTRDIQSSLLCLFVSAEKMNFNDIVGGRLNTVDLQVLTSLNQLGLIMQTFFTFYKQTNLRRRSTVLSLPLQIVFFGYFYQLSRRWNIAELVFEVRDQLPGAVDLLVDVFRIVRAHRALKPVKKTVSNKF